MKTYKGLIPEPAVRNYFEHKVQLQKSSPFSRAKLETYEKYGYLTKVEPIVKDNKNWRCTRCRNEDPLQFVRFNCARCKKVCMYCRHCINMGRISSCTTLYIWTRPSRKIKHKHTFEWQGQYTKAQEKAAWELKESLLVGRPHLLHAVCGAGKTEILFPAIFALLQRGDNVALATPRTDVVLELAPRLKAVFPNTSIHALYGGAPKRGGTPQLTITTTHQLYKFYEAFDAIIVDEADAFPYTYDISLQRAVMKAKKSHAPVAIVTATPNLEQVTEAKRHGGYSFIPRRYHGYKLPVPRTSPLFNYSKKILKGSIPQKLRRWTEEQLSEARPFLIFFPEIDLMEKALPLFQKLHPDILSVHAEDPERKAKVMQLRNEEVPGLLTTTILERGITIKNVQVAVVGAENKIFTDSALIQIAGRVGRNKDFHDGDVVFFHHGLSVEIDSAIRQIKALNEVEVLES